MLKRDFVCDRCGKVIGKPLWTNPIFELSMETSAFGCFPKRHHLCKGCYEEFRKFISTEVTENDD